MESIFEKLKILSYELFGIFLPGLVFVSSLISVLLIFQYQNLSPEVVIVSLQSFLDQKLIRYFLEKPLLILCAASVILYISGHLLKWISKDGIWSSLPFGIISSFSGNLIGNGLDMLIKHTLKKANIKDSEVKERFGRVIFLRSSDPSNKPSSFSVNMEFLIREGVDRFFSSDNSSEDTIENLKKWPTFYNVARNYVVQQSDRSLVTLYQNKYTFHRSVATAFAVSFWGSVAVLVASLIDAEKTSFVLISLPVFLSLFSYIFYASYEFYWRIWGDQVITDFFLLVKGKGRDKNA